MVVPIYSTKTTPAMLKECIDCYTYQPELVDYIMNSYKNPEYKNQADYKTIESFKRHKPTDYIISHASDLVVDPQDLELMIKHLDSDDTLFMVGLYPGNHRMGHARLGEEIVWGGRVGVWKSNIFEECLVEFEKQQEKNTMVYDEMYRMALIAHDKGYSAGIAGYARPWHFDNDDQFRNMRIK